jgi:F0F1-type ATP synthase membrane subunit c/vacuolar-type H+-ATPase subunit K
MSQAIGREEHDAKIDAIRQEMRADSANVRADIAGYRADVAATMQRISQTMESMQGDLRQTNEKVSALKWWILGAVLTVVLGVYGTSIAIQQMTVSTFQAGAQAAKDSAPAAKPATEAPLPTAPAASK